MPAAGASATAASSPSAPDEPAQYPKYCLALMFAVTAVSLLLHMAPTDWMRAAPPPAHSFAHEDTEIAKELFAAPSVLPHATVMEEVRRPVPARRQKLRALFPSRRPLRAALTAPAALPPPRPPSARCLTWCTAATRAACARPRRGAAPRA